MSRNACAFLAFITITLVGLVAGLQYELVTAAERRAERVGTTTVERLP